MPSYRILLVAEDQRVIGALAQECPDDEEVVRQARGLHDDYAIEIWEGKRRIATLTPADGSNSRESDPTK